MKAKICLGMILMLVSCARVTETSYASLSEIPEGTKEQGFIPTWLPNSAVDINEAHRVNSDKTILHWRYMNKEWLVPTACVRIDPVDLPKPRLRRSWWPRDIPPAKSKSTSRHAYYRCERDKGFLAVQPLAGEAFFWRP